MSTLAEFIVFDTLRVSNLKLMPKRVQATYTTIRPDGLVASKDLIYSYESITFQPDSATDQNLASLMVVQVALNYGLFCRKLVLAGSYEAVDRRFLEEMLENTSREILTNKLGVDNPFIKSDYKPLEIEERDRYTQATLVFESPENGLKSKAHPYPKPCFDKYAILSSGGKDSLLTYGIVKEMGEAHPVFVNESGRHWFTAVNAHRYFKKTEPNTVKPWCNSDRIFNWMLRQMPFIREDFIQVSADIYPIRLWTVAVFVFGVLPVALKRGAGNILIGNEYDTTLRGRTHGISHYNGLYDQSRYFDNAFTLFYRKKGWYLRQYSLLRSMSELLIMKVLIERFPELQTQQVSCHAAHEKGGRMYPCGKCEKCRRIIGMMIALDANPENCGYGSDQIANGLEQLATRPVKQIGSDAAHLYHLLSIKEKIPRGAPTQKVAKAHPEILCLRFDQERSRLEDLPNPIREPLLSLLLPHTHGCVKKRIHPGYLSIRIQLIYKPLNTLLMAFDAVNSFLWEQMKWPEIQAKLKITDTAILPCGAIEQHGPHLPVDVDYFDAYYMAREIARACKGPKPFVIPPIPYGVSYHHSAFKGTLSVTNNALSALVYDIGMSLAHNGIKKIVLLNGHGDNKPTLTYAAQMINRDAKIFVCVETGETSDIDLYDMIDTHNDIHAGEIETSTTLAIRPELVDMEQAVDETLDLENEFLDFTSDRGVSWYAHTQKLSKSGIIGNASKGNAEKGKRMWEISIGKMVEFVESIIHTPLEELHQNRY